ncbi:MAG: hypothetical protein FWH27_14675 [Planctomycetaceae bacterium]|nr:hypothetical protein [Planctomycetaceae bacterium]
MKKLIVFLSCQRCGSSFTARYFHHLGMSLGPFEMFLGAPDQPLGYCEAIPICDIDHQFHIVAYGFREDTLDYHLAGHIMKNRDILMPGISQIPYEWLEEGKNVLESLICSSDLTGFKHPVVLLFWFYWDYLLSQFHGLGIHLIFLIRPPSAIASSYARRFSQPKALCDLIEVYFVNQLRLYHSWQGKKNLIRFTGVFFQHDFEQAVQGCGLTWDSGLFSQLYDASTTCDKTIKLDHPVQRRYRELASLVG